MAMNQMQFHAGLSMTQFINCKAARRSATGRCTAGHVNPIGFHCPKCNGRP